MIRSSARTLVACTASRKYDCGGALRFAWVIGTTA